MKVIVNRKRDFSHLPWPFVLVEFKVTIGPSAYWFETCHPYRDEELIWDLRILRQYGRELPGKAFKQIKSLWREEVQTKKRPD